MGLAVYSGSIKRCSSQGVYTSFFDFFYTFGVLLAVNDSKYRGFYTKVGLSKGNIDTFETYDWSCVLAS